MKLLFIGNSFSDDTLEYAHRIAASLGERDVFMGVLYFGGCSLKQHVEHAEENAAVYEFRRADESGEWYTVQPFSIKDALCSCEWDYVAMHQYSGDSGIAETYEYVEPLIAYVKKYSSASVKFIWNITWAYQSDSDHCHFPRYGCDQLKMYGEIINAVKERIVGHPDISVITPVGTAVQNARTSFLGDTLTRDGFHLSFGLGRYIAALTFVAALTGARLTDGVYCLQGLGEEYKRVAIESAENAIKNPLEITKSQYGD